MASLQQSLSGHTSDVNGLDFNSNTLASCSSDRTVRLWSLVDFTELPCSPLVTHVYPVHCCVFSSNGGILASCSTDGKCILWDPKTGYSVATVSHPSGSSIRTCRFSPCDEILATGCDDNTIGLWKVASKKLIKLLSGHEASVPALAFTPDSVFMVSGTPDGHLFVFDAIYGHGKNLLYEADAHDLGVTCCQFSPTFGTASMAHTLKHGGACHFLLATGGFDNLVKLWDFTGHVGTTKVSLKRRSTFDGHGEPVLCISFSPDGDTLISGSNDHTIRLWDVFKGVELANINAHTRYVTSCAFSRDGRLIASASNDKTIKVWTLRNSNSDICSPDLIQFDSNLADSAKEPSASNAPLKSMAPERKLPEQWNVNEVCQFLAEIGLSQYAENFRGNAIDGVELLTLNDQTLKKAIKIDALGHRNKILRAVEQIEKHPMKQPLQRHSSISKDDQVPDEYLCPITMELMRDPVIACDGYSYERAAITSWIANGKKSSPMTNSPLQNNQLTPNRSLKILIQKYAQQRP